MTNADPDALLAFWFSDRAKDRWFDPDAAFDAEVTARFGAAWRAAAAGDLADWEATPQGALALVLALDQAPRNMFRADPRAFSTDALAKAVATRALTRGFDQAVTPEQRHFFYLPFMHSEDPADQDACVRLMEAAGLVVPARHAREHSDTIARFGRFPGRNAALGRPSTEDEIRFLSEEAED